MLQMTQTSALPDSVPFEVTIGAPPPQPKASVEVPTSESAGSPVPETPYL